VRVNSRVNTLDSLIADFAVPDAPPDDAPTAETLHDEIIVDRKTGAVRQAGSDPSGGTGAFVGQFKAEAERNLFTFAVGVLGRTYLTRTLHAPVCNWLLDFTKFRRKLLLMPREHCKTTLIGHALTPHMVIQPKDANIYIAGLDGRDTTIVLAGESADRASDALRVVQSVFEGNTIFRALWPHVCWDNPRASKKWNETEMIVRHDHRGEELPDPTIRGIGVGGAITGAHPRILIKDDLATRDAANSAAVMQDAIQWHVTSRALINKPECLEFMTTTRWAAYDWARFIMDSDKSVDVMLRSGIEHGTPIYPEGGFTLAKFDQLRSEFGVLFPFLYLNTAIGAGITAFDMAEVRQYVLEGENIVVGDDPRDFVLTERAKPAAREENRPNFAVSPGEHPGTGREGWLRTEWSGPGESGGRMRLRQG